MVEDHSEMDLEKQSVVIAENGRIRRRLELLLCQIVIRQDR